jgi:hypothetical protein
MQVAHRVARVMPLQFKTEEETRRAVDSILCDPWINQRITHDHRHPGYINHPSVSYLGAYVLDKLVGVFTVIESGYIELDLHAALKEEALPFSRELGHLCLRHVFADPSLSRVTAYIIEGLATARNYCLKLGFRDEGMRRDACMKDGRLVGVHVLGMTRRDWELFK